MMEDPEESLDGSSIKPVSSLRSIFEQMGNSKSSNTLAARAISPQPTGSSVSNAARDIVRPVSVRPEARPFGDGLRPTRGRELESEEGGLRSFRTASAHPPSPSPTRPIRPRPLSTLPPSVTVQPPQSPPKVKALNLNLANTQSYLSTDTSLSATPGASSPSPRQFRIPSRPNTPHLEPRRSPKLSPSQPPSPPPPRRSGEFRRERDAPSKPAPPPVNRAEKPKFASKPAALNLNFRTQETILEPSHAHSSARDISPFSTPPGSGSSPEYELPAPPLPGPRPRPQSTLEPNSRTFEPPPVHHSVISRRRDQDTNGLNRGLMSPQITGDPRPTLPNRPQAASDTKSRAPSSMMPPPLRPSVDTAPARLSPLTAESTPTYTTPPKRVFSQPTSQQLQTPPRSHGRSMTVDRTSDRAPAEFRTTTIVPYSDSRQNSHPPSTTSLLKEPPPPGDYPDASLSNRRPPYFEKFAREISTKSEPRIFDVCGQYVCTSGQFTRVWSLVDGVMVTNLPNSEGVKIISVAFKPSEEIKDEGTKLWLGSNVGEIMEVDIYAGQGGSIVATKANAHTRREIIKIYRHRKEMWTLDDGGTLHIWGPDSTGCPQLTNPYQSYRLPKGHSFSMVVVDELWHATGKDIRVFVPTLDGSTQFQILQRPLNQPNTGDITSGTSIGSQPDKVYFGHSDGKVTIYSRRDYSCLGVFNVSIYKITSLAGVDGNLWAGFSTGMIYVYDTTKPIWVAKKDWQAHDNPVQKLISDRSSCWTLNRAQVVSLGQDNMIRIWDGLLQDDWIENQMQSQEDQYCELDTISTLVMTWNAGASTPYHLQHSDQDASFFRDLIQGSNCPDILVFGFQELVDLEDKKAVTKSIFKSSKKKDPSEMEHMSHQYRDWRDYLTRCLDDYMPRNELYHLLHTAHLVGLFSCIFVRAPLRDRIRSVSAVEVKRGLGGRSGNKGALVIRFVLDDSSVCFINCHLAAGQTQTKDRNHDITTILESSILPAERDHSVRQDSYIGGGDGSMILDHELCILNGDLNYRIDTMGRDTVVSAVKSKNLNKLLERDQLLASKRKNPWFKLRSFHELPITFAPTYKYDVGTDNYDTSDKKRAPAWCDRVLYRGKGIQQLDYRRHEVRVSDHRPVTGSFTMTVKKISPQKRAVKWEECQRRMQERKERLLQEAKVDYLANVLGIDDTTIGSLTLQRTNR